MLETALMFLVCGARALVGQALDTHLLPFGGSALQCKKAQQRKIAAYLAEIEARLLQ